MHFSIKAKGITLTDAIKAAVDAKIASLDKKIAGFGESVKGEVEVEKTTKHHKKGDVFRAEIHVRLPGKLVYAESTSTDLYKALGEAKREAELQIAKHKGIQSGEKRRVAKKTKGGRE